MRGTMELCLISSNSPTCLPPRYVMAAAESVSWVDDKKRKQFNFYTRQFVDAMAPTNFALTNADVLKRTMDSQGENLVRGFQNILTDLERGQGQLKTRMVDTDAFELGRDLALTPGKVILQNDLIQLIQYELTTKAVSRTPLLVIPPWINKYYILDLQPKNSFIRWLVSQGTPSSLFPGFTQAVNLRTKGLKTICWKARLRRLMPSGNYQHGAEQCHRLLPGRDAARRAAGLPEGDWCC